MALDLKICYLEATDPLKRCVLWKSWSLTAIRLQNRTGCPQKSQPCSLTCLPGFRCHSGVLQVP